MEEEKSNLTVIQGGISEKTDEPKLAPTTGLTEGQPSKTVVMEKPEGFAAKLRRALPDIAKKMDTNPENKPPLGKGF